ncbi:MAG: hypothetical protein HWE21_01815 [Cytophagia bacterium]|nr:hypothetical protein [Cytophagia bacterium]
MTKYYQLVYLFLIACLLVSSCVEDEPFSDQQIPTTEYIRYSADDIPDVVNDLFKSTGFKHSDETFSANLGYDDVALNITWNEILMLKDSLGRKAYAFEIKPEANNDPKVFYNLILKYTPDGEVRDPYVMRYTMSDEFYPTYLQTGSLEGFVGKVAKLQLTVPGSSSGEYSVNDPYDPSGPIFSQECPESDVNNPGGGSGSGDTGGGDTYLVCEYYVYYQEFYTEVCSSDGNYCSIKQYERFPVYSSSCYYMTTMSVADETSCDEDEDLPIISPLRFEEQIDDTNLKPCMKSLISSIKTQTKGLSWVINHFAGNNANYNWKVEHGVLQGDYTAITPNNSYNSATGTVTTIFDTNKYKNSSDLSIVKTILHESVHAYLISYFRNDPINAGSTYADLVRDHGNSVYPSLEEEHHAEIVRSFVNQIAGSLEEFGVNKGYSLSSQFYSDLAWSGLTHWKKRDAQGNVVKDSNGNDVYEETSWFKSTFNNASDRGRVLKTINDELGRNGSNNQKGNNAGC